METGWDDGCLECKQEETILNRSSMRQNMNRSFTSDKIEFVELSVSNQCNITCRMCNSTYSSKWAEVDKIEIPKQDFHPASHVKLNFHPGFKHQTEFSPGFKYQPEFSTDFKYQAEYSPRLHISSRLFTRLQI